MAKKDETREPLSANPNVANPNVASPPPKRKGLLLVATITLAIWLVVLTSLAVYSVWG